MLTIRAAQMKALQKDAIRRHRVSLFAYLTEAFPEYSVPTRSALFSDCMAYAAKEGIETEYGLTSLTTISFIAGKCIGDDPDFCKIQGRCVAATGDPEAAANAIYEGLY